MRLAYAALALLAACSGGSDTDTDALACPAAEAPRVVATGFDGGTEGAATGPDGTVYVTARDGGVFVIGDDGAVTPFADVPGPVGAAWWRGALWVASWEDASGAAAPALVEITPDGSATRHPTPTIERPNFLAPTPWGTLLVADDFVDGIVEWRGDDDVAAWAPDVPSPNGLAFTPDGATLYAASTFREPGLWRVSVADGVASPAEKLVAFEATDAPDGLALGADGSVLVALNLDGTVARWAGDAATPVASLPNPASLAFDRGGCTVVATSLFGADVWRFDAPTPGAFATWAD